MRDAAPSSHVRSWASETARSSIKRNPYRGDIRSKSRHHAESEPPARRAHRSASASSGQAGFWSTSAALSSSRRIKPAAEKRTKIALTLTAPDDHERDIITASRLRRSRPDYAGRLRLVSCGFGVDPQVEVSHGWVDGESRGQAALVLGLLNELSREPDLELRDLAAVLLAFEHYRKVDCS